MAGSRLAAAVTLLAGVALAVPLTGSSLFEKRDNGICAAVSDCIPFTIDVTWGQINPTGAGPRAAILSNGTSPGPPLKMKLGECVDFLVINHLDVETGVHFHGIQQSKTPWADGVPGLSQYAIQAGDSYMYRWTAEEVGSYFYHSHYKGQLMDGLFGAIFIMPSDSEPTPFKAIDASATDKLTAAYAKSEPIFISDWSKYTFDEFYKLEEAANVDIDCSDAILLNNIGSQYCLSRDQIANLTSPQITALNITLTNKGCIPPDAVVQGNYTRNLAALPADAFNTCTKSSSGKNYTHVVDPADGWASMSLISAAGFEVLKATIDNHKLYVYEYNGRYVTPQVVDQVIVGNGDRVSFFVKLNQTVGDYPIRVSNNGQNQIISGFGALSYKGSKGPAPGAVAAMTFAGASIGKITTFSALKASPFVAPAEFSKTADKTFRFTLQKLPKAGNAYRWTLSGNAAYDMSNDDGMPLLYKNPASIPESDIVKKTNYGDWVDIIMHSPGPVAQPHPIHKHSNKFFMIGQGAGNFSWSNVAEAYAANSSLFNFNNPPYLDGYTTIAALGDVWTVFRYKVEIPGAWFIHCHMQTHLSGGMAVALLDGVDKWPTVPTDAGKTCQGQAASNSSWTPSADLTASNTTASGSATTSQGTPKTYTGAASAVQVSTLTLLAIFVAALSL